MPFRRRLQSRIVLFAFGVGLLLGVLFAGTAWLGFDHLQEELVELMRGEEGPEEIARLRQVVAALLVAGAGAAAYLATWLGLWVSDRVLAPLNELARRVHRLRPGVAAPEPLAPQFADDVVRELAEAFDAYAARLAEALAREREFTAAASHELRTPLTVIRGSAGILLADGTLPPRARRAAERIERAARRMTELVEVLLVLARGGEGAAAPVPVAPPVREAVEAQRHLLRPGVTLTVEADESAQVAAAPAAVAMVAGNLVANALLHTEAGAVRVRADAAGLVVEDTGRGIDPAEAARLFEPGYRGAGAAPGGEGLGLTVVRRICAHYGWAVRLAPREGGGTRAEVCWGGRGGAGP
ncbi:sensor histidine kinase [Inmirania thermothiophila]|uniref:histidine kinase n=1 Tax=Inmirania thermothiophila TaxID=1750597 RepID=A0A3N1Y800_9GAMM|nr:HAMP domain-containing sensor histidine kinase [Inmirania thermothiophila]ROR34880.1 signal transduction histidine kinase [Inmirania thermothiophila]